MGIMDLTGKTLIDAKYDSIEEAKTGMFIAENLINMELLILMIQKKCLLI